MSKEELVSMYLPYLRKANKRFRKKWIKSMAVFRKPFAQPVLRIKYSKKIPKSKTGNKGLYLANMRMVYPYDRGTNYAVKMGREVAKQVLIDLRQSMWSADLLIILKTYIVSIGLQFLIWPIITIHSSLICKMIISGHAGSAMPCFMTKRSINKNRLNRLLEKSVKNFQKSTNSLIKCFNVFYSIMFFTI